MAAMALQDLVARSSPFGFESELLNKMFNLCLWQSCRGHREALVEMMPSLSHGLGPLPRFSGYSDVESFCHHPRNGSLVENNDRPSFPAFGDSSRFASGRSTKQAARDVRWSTKSSSMAIIFNDMPTGVPQFWCLIQVHIWIRKCNLWQDHRSPSCWVVILWGDCWKVGWYPNWLNKLVPKIGQVG